MSAQSMRRPITLAILLAVVMPFAAIAQPKPAMKVAGDGFPTGQDSPEGAAADFVRAFIAADTEAFKRVCIRAYMQGDSRKDYEAFLDSTTSDIRSERTRTARSPGGPKAIGKVFAVRHFRRSGPASYGYAGYGFQDVAFVDVGVYLHNGKRGGRRALVIKDRDGKWYVHPTPYVDPFFGPALKDEPPSTIDFSEVYRPVK